MSKPKAVELETWHVRTPHASYHVVAKSTEMALKVFYALPERRGGVFSITRGSTIWMLVEAEIERNIPPDEG